MHVTLFLCLIWLQTFVTNGKEISIAVVGAGLGSAGVVHYLHKQLGNHWPKHKVRKNLRVDVYEQDLRIGGRILSVYDKQATSSEKEAIEMGCQYLGSTNDRYLMQILSELQQNIGKISVKYVIKHNTSQHNYILLDQEQKLPLNLSQKTSFLDWFWNDNFVALSHDLRHFKSLYSYGYQYSFQLINLINDFNQKMEILRKLVDSSGNAKTKLVKYLLQQSDLFELTQLDCETYLHNHLIGFDQHRVYLAILDELVTARLRQFTGQGFDMNALTCMHALSSVLQTNEDQLIQLQYGNDQIVYEIFKFYHIRPKLGRLVTSIVELENKQYQVKYRERSVHFGHFEHESQEIGSIDFYDFVIIATPLENAGIKMIPLPQHHDLWMSEIDAFPEIRHKSSFVTIVDRQQGRLNLSTEFFGMSPSDLKYSESTPISSILVTNKQYVPMFWFLEITDHYYRIYSRHKLAQDQFQDMFSQSKVKIVDRNHVTRKEWIGAPVNFRYKLNEDKDFFSFQLFKNANVYYLNAMSHIMDSVETSLVQAKNVAKLVIGHFLADRKH